MKTPELFIPSKRLDIPLGLDDFVDLELIRDSKPRMVNFGAVNIIKMHFPSYPIWEPYQDETAGKVHVAMSKDKVRLRSTIEENANPIAPYSADGTLFRPDIDTIFTHGVLHENGSVHVWWGVSTFDINSGETPDKLTSWISYHSDEAFRDFDIRRG